MELTQQSKPTLAIILWTWRWPWAIEVVSTEPSGFMGVDSVAAEGGDLIGIAESHSTACRSHTCRAAEPCAEGTLQGLQVLHFLSPHQLKVLPVGQAHPCVPD